MLVHPATSELNTQPVQNPLIISPRRTASCNFSLLFFFPLSRFTLFIYLLIFFFFLSRQFVHAQGSSWFSFAHPINLFFSFLLFFPYTRVIIIIIKSPARYIDCVYAIVSFLAKFFLTIIRTNRSFLFFFFSPPVSSSLFFSSPRFSDSGEADESRDPRIGIIFFLPPLPHSIFLLVIHLSQLQHALRACMRFFSRRYLFTHLFTYSLYIFNIKKPLQC